MYVCWLQIVCQEWLQPAVSPVMWHMAQTWNISLPNIQTEKASVLCDRGHAMFWSHVDIRAGVNSVTRAAINDYFHNWLSCLLLPRKHVCRVAVGQPLQGIQGHVNRIFKADAENRGLKNVYVKYWSIYNIFLQWLFTCLKTVPKTFFKKSYTLENKRFSYQCILENILFTLIQIYLSLPTVGP